MLFSQSICHAASSSRGTNANSKKKLIDFWQLSLDVELSQCLANLGCTFKNKTRLNMTKWHERSSPSKWLHKFHQEKPITQPITQQNHPLFPGPRPGPGISWVPPWSPWSSSSPRALARFLARFLGSGKLPPVFDLLNSRRSMGPTYGSMVVVEPRENRGSGTTWDANSWDNRRCLECVNGIFAIFATTI